MDALASESAYRLLRKALGLATLRSPYARWPFQPGEVRSLDRQMPADWWRAWINRGMK